MHKAASLKEDQPENVIIKQESLVSEHDYLFGKKKDDTRTIDVKSQQDFPTLGDEMSGGNKNGTKKT